MMRPLPPSCAPARRDARGVSLIFSLLALVALSLAAVALIRAVNTGSGILGNLGFKQDSLLAADDATRRAIDWLSPRIGQTLLHQHLSGGGYYAASVADLDPTGSGSGARTLIDWDDNDCQGHSPCLEPFPVVTLANGVKARALILRLCSGTGDPSAAGSTLQCARPMTASLARSGDSGALDYSNPRHLSAPVQTQYYRILVRAKGARNTLSYTDTVVHY
ncbi:MAG: pilus assembly protein PilX [Burkholderiaceae bacterium]|nr:pilus assembly protein PilX [Burkholderiaceae bacterium]